ncbi:MAG: Scr1 family TA system antitoxin-like transcriptional regulator [Pseudonocardiaceae bacterium]
MSRNGWPRDSFHGGAPDIDAAVRARMQRQEYLYDPGKHFRFLVTEAALRYLVCPPATLRAQLDRLVVLSGLDTVELAVLPFEARLPSHRVTTSGSTMTGWCWSRL